jgi:hypothetical protein
MNITNSINVDEKCQPAVAEDAQPVANKTLQTRQHKMHVLTPLPANHSHLLCRKPNRTSHIFTIMASRMDCANSALITLKHNMQHPV